MSDKSQRRKERHDRKRRERIEQKRKKDRKLQQVRARAQIFTRQAIDVVGLNARHRRRLALQVPRAWHGELAEDVAVFDDSALATLPPEQATCVAAVRRALRNATESRPDEALRQVAAIPRSSPSSEWRLFVRGLVDWLAGDTDAASEAWNRLDAERRPGRIATSMMLALRTDLEIAVPSVDRAASEGAASERAVPSGAGAPGEAADRSGAGEPGRERSSSWSRFDAQQLYHARLLRKVRFDRSALRVAEAGLSVPEEAQELHLGPAKIRWLKQFIAEFESTEPELTAALSRIALGRAFHQQYSDLFDDAVRSFPGPRHDPRNRLLRFFFLNQFGDAEIDAQRSLDEYLGRDLPRNERLTDTLRSALAGTAHLNYASVLIERSDASTVFAFLYDSPDETPAIRRHLLASADAYPANRRVYQTHAAWVEAQLEDRRTNKSKRAALDNELASVMERWAIGVPDDVAPHLWLVDHYLENDRLDEARPHVERLTASRVEDPRVRAMPWKLQLLEAMRLSKRRTWLADAPARLDEAERLWPAWLSRQWLPYLRAAWLFRAGRFEEFEARRDELSAAAGVARDGLADACMMLAAVQRMQVGSADLKPFRAALDEKLKGIRRLPTGDLIEAAGFFWDFHRVQLLYPAYRMHGAAIGKELCGRLKGSDPILRRLDDPRVSEAVLWASENQFWAVGYAAPMPGFLSRPDVARRPMLQAAKLNAFLKRRYFFGVDEFRSLGGDLRAAAPAQRDAYYRYWFKELADKLDDAAAKLAARVARVPFEIFGGDADPRNRADDLDEWAGRGADPSGRRPF